MLCLLLAKRPRSEAANWLEFSSRSNGLVPAGCKVMDRVPWGLSDEADDTTRGSKSNEEKEDCLRWNKTIIGVTEMMNKG